MRKILVVIDMQNDFIDGALGTPEAQKIVDPVKNKMRTIYKKDIFATRDTHNSGYLDTQEGQNLPVCHCIRGTDGWKMPHEIEEGVEPENIFDKPTFGSLRLAERLREISKQEAISIELVGLCTDICVISNALLFKAEMPEVPISVDASCCAGVTPERHRNALDAMEACQIEIKNR